MLRTDYFLNMIKTLRREEKIILYGNIIDIKEREEAEMIGFLRKEYASESLGYPHQAPEFSAEAALWAAKTVYTAAQLILYRENKGLELPGLFPDYSGNRDSAAILSADLCLRFLPDMLKQLYIIDQEDPLYALLEKLLNKWHYSGVLHKLEPEKLIFSEAYGNACLKQLYCDRIMHYKRTDLAKLDVFRDHIAGNLSIYAEELWKDFNTEMIINGKYQKAE